MKNGSTGFEAIREHLSELEVLRESLLEDGVTAGFVVKDSDTSYRIRFRNAGGRLLSRTIKPHEVEKYKRMTENHRRLTALDLAVSRALGELELYFTQAEANRGSGRNREVA